MDTEDDLGLAVVSPSQMMPARAMRAGFLIARLQIQFLFTIQALITCVSPT